MRQMPHTFCETGPEPREGEPATELGARLETRPVPSHPVHSSERLLTKLNGTFVLNKQTKIVYV